MSSMTELLKQIILSLTIHTGLVTRLYVMLTHYCLCAMPITNVFSCSRHVLLSYI